MKKLIKVYFLFFIGISFLNLSLYAQSTEPEFIIHQKFNKDSRSVAVGDIDGDMDLDLLIVFKGHTTDPPYFRVFFNDGNANFFESIQNFPDDHISHVYLGDLDRDGDLDAIITSPPRIYFNDGNGLFIDSGQTIIPQSGYLQYLAIGDLDNDGDLDFVNSNLSESKLEVFLNDGNGLFSNGQLFGFLWTYNVALVDIDNDGDLDVGVSMNWGPTRIYLNNGDAIFSTSIMLGEIAHKQSGPAFADFNGDGLIDVVEGYTSEPSYNRVYFNQGNNEFIESGQKLGAYRTSHLIVCDVDNDGDIDIVESTGRAYLNSGDGFFMEANSRVGGGEELEVGVGDFDSDIDLDFFCTHVLLNNISQIRLNTPPSAPSNILSEVNGNQINLSWESGSDSQSASELLTYNLRIGSTSGGNDIFYSEIGPNNTTPSFGNCWHTFKKTMTLPNGIYYWSVQTVDPGFMRSNWHPEKNFYIGIREVDIDIKPGSYPNSINLGSNGNVPVAIFSRTDFDATQVDPTTVSLAGASVKLKGRGTPMASYEDVDGDGLQDIIVHVDTTALQLSAGDTDAVLAGETYDGQKIRGVDTVRIVQE